MILPFDFAAEADPLPVAVTSADPLLRYSGRFQGEAAAKGVRCAWSGSAVTLRFEGDRLNVRLGASSNSDAYEVIIDGVSAGVLSPRSGSHRYCVYPAGGSAPAKPGIHTVTLFKRTEALFGIITFLGFELPKGGRLLQLPPRRARRLEIIGDSISCGYGNEAASEKDRFSSKTENAYRTYGAIASRRFAADYTCIAWSGRCMWPKNTMDEVYDRTLPTETGSRWNFARWTPDVVVINLGTNDFSAGVPPGDSDWIKGYRTFIGRVRKNYPRAMIYCTSSPMLWGDKDTRQRRNLHRIVEEENRAGDPRVRFLDFKTQNPADGFGADWHPSVKTHRIMASALSAALIKDLRWEPAAGIVD